MPSSIELELATNPFMRCDQKELQAITGFQDPAAVLAEIRLRKDQF